MQMFGSVALSVEHVAAAGTVVVCADCLVAC
jgi:hypothetical protein